MTRYKGQSFFKSGAALISLCFFITCIFSSTAIAAASPEKTEAKAHEKKAIEHEHSEHSHAGGESCPVCEELKKRRVLSSIEDSESKENKESHMEHMKKHEEIKLDTDEKKFSYSIGMEVGNSLKAMPTELEIDALFLGIKDVLKGFEKRIKPAEAKQIKKNKFKKMKKESEKKMKDLGKINKEEGKKFLAENLKKDGIKSTDTGLQYEILKEGTGPNPTQASVVEVHYEGTLLNGEVFDSSYKRGETIEFPLGRVIKGWTEGLQLMNKGAKFKFYIPSDLAYGEYGAPPKIAPNATLIFTVELISFK